MAKTYRTRRKTKTTSTGKGRRSTSGARKSRSGTSKAAKKATSRRKPKSTAKPARKTARAKRKTAKRSTVVALVDPQSPAIRIGKLFAQVAADVEPTPEQIAAEQALIDEEIQSQRNTGRQAPPPGKDLLASYMEQLSHIPLFTPRQEIDNARHLETLELFTWQLILRLPKGAYHALGESVELDPKIPRALNKLLESYRRSAARTRKRKLPVTKDRERILRRAAKLLRQADFDKAVLDRVMNRLRREVWGRRVLNEKPSFRVNHSDLTEIERARGYAVRARNNFVRANLRLVVSVARNFHHYRIPFIDLIQEGNVGLMKAVHRFDHKRGFRFSTYAHWWIRQSIERAIINKGSQVRLPVHVIDSRRQVARATAKLTQRLGRAPNVKEIAKQADLPKAKVEQIRQGVQQDPVSLDESVGNDDSRKFLDLLKRDDVALDEQLIRENTHDRVRELLQLLNPIEKDIIRRRFGLGNDTDQTLDEIGKLYNLSRERVRQIQAQGLMKMRRMCERREISLS